MDSEVWKVTERFIESRFPGCRAALVGGSVVRGEAGVHSDVDVVVLIAGRRRSYREILEADSRLFETYVLNDTAAKRLCEYSVQSGTGAFLRLCATATVLRDDEVGSGKALKQYTRTVWQAGPPLLDLDRMNEIRYAITEELYDFIDSNDESMMMFLAYRLAELTTDFVLRANNRWSGEGKWLYRCLRDYDTHEFDRLETALDEVREHGQKDTLIAFVNDAIAPYGGKLLIGYRQAVKR